MSMESALLLIILAAIAVIMGAWVVLMAGQPSKPEPPTLDTRGPDDR